MILFVGILLISLTFWFSLRSTNKSDAETIYTNAKIYTVDPSNPWAEAMAISDGRLIGVGKAAEIASLRAKKTRVIDLEGQMIMPGIHDMHAHPVVAGIRHLYHCKFSPSDFDEALKAIMRCVDETSDGDWIKGGMWSSDFFPDDRTPKDILDDASTTHPIFFNDITNHSAWLNSAAMRELGITAETKDPPGGSIERDPSTGEATGLLLETAASLYGAQVPMESIPQVYKALRWSFGAMTTHGITSVKEAVTPLPLVQIYKGMNLFGKLDARVTTCLSWGGNFGVPKNKTLAFLAKNKGKTSDMLNTGCVKIILDGVPPFYTAALLEPYAPSKEHGDNYRGSLIFEAQELTKDVIALDATGATIKIHATGDRSLRIALDAFEAARRTNGDKGQIHEIAHAQMIHDDDLHRFNSLNVAADMSPILWHPQDYNDKSALGDRTEFWPFRNLLAAGAHVIYGSDWPAMAPSPNPWPGIEAMVTRRDPYGRLQGSVWADQAISLEDAIRIVTLNGAVSARTANRTGSLEVGKAADFIVLDQNIFEVPVESVSDTQVLKTVIDGKVAYERSSAR